MASEHQGGKQGSQRGSQTGSPGRGFASMDPQRQRQIASQGGKAAHRSGNAHEFTSEEAREAGRKSRGGQGGGGASGSSRAAGADGSSGQHQQTARQSHPKDR